MKQPGARAERMDTSTGVMVGRQIRVTVACLSDGARTQTHCHQQGHLVYAGTGAYIVDTTVGTWVAPPWRALWVPPGTPHHARASGAVSLHTVYIDSHAATVLPPDCRTVNVGDLLRALILEAARLNYDRAPTRREVRILGLLLDEIRPATDTTFHLPMPSDERTSQLCRELQADLAANLTLAEWGKRVGASARTLARTFKRETGITFAQWRQEARLLAAVERLARGEPVAVVAARVGYSSPSAFSQMFRHALGVSPIHYYAGLGGI